MKNRTCSCVLFDMDGLLVDTERVYAEGWVVACEKGGVQVPLAEINSWAGLSIAQTTANLLQYTDDVQTLRAYRETYLYEQLHKGKVLEKPYATHVLQVLRENGFKLGVATSSMEGRATAVLEALGLAQYFAYRAFASEVEHAKPAPDLYQLVMQKAGVRPEDCLVAEDTLVGAAAAGNAGIDVVLVPDKSFGHTQTEYPAHVIAVGEDLREVLRVLGLV